MPKEKNLGQMIVDGELDATRWIDARNLIDRSTVDPLSSPNVRYLFPDPDGEAKRYYDKTNIYPINHTVVVRRSIVEKYPWVVLNLYTMFVEAMNYSARDLDTNLVPYYESGLLDDKAKKTVENRRDALRHQGQPAHPRNDHPHEC